MSTTSPFSFPRARKGSAAICALALLLSVGALSAETWRSFESPDNPEALRQKIEALLNRLDPDNYRMEPETMGFTYLFANRWTSPYTYRIYGGNVSEKQTMTVLRLEGRTGDVRTFSRIFEQEKLIRVEPLLSDEGKELLYAPLEPKWHTVGQTLNLVAPWLGVLHASWNSPRMSAGQTVFRFSVYFGIDAVLVWAAGRNFFRDHFDAQKYAGNIAAVLAVPRIIGAVQEANMVRGHNRIVEMKYTFPVK